MQGGNHTTRRRGTGLAKRQSIGSVIKARRLEKGMSLSDLAVAAGCSPSHLSRIERGLSVPSYQIVGRVASILGVDQASLSSEERAAEEVDHALDSWIERLKIPETARGDFLRLLPETRAELVAAFDLLTEQAVASGTQQR